MRRNFLIWGLLWILSLVLISFYGGTVTYGLFFLLTITPLVSLLYLLYIYIFFHMYQKVDSKWLVVDDTIPFYFTLVNDYYVIFAGIRVNFYSDFSNITGLDEKTEYEFFPKSGVTLNTNITCKCRGEYEVGIKKVIIQDYFRLFSISYKNREPLKVVVRPKIVRLESIENVELSFSSRDSSTADTEADVLSRAYVYGDDLRQANWGLTARTGELMIRKRSTNEQEGIAILLLTKRISDEELVYLPIENKLLEINLALAMYMLEKNVPVKHYHQGYDLIQRNITGIEQFDAYYEMISGVVFDQSFDMNEFLSKVYSDYNLMKSRIVFLLTDMYCKELGNLLADYDRYNISIVLYFVGESLPEELKIMSLPRVQIKLIHPLADLREVM